MRQLGIFGMELRDLLFALFSYKTRAISQSKLEIKINPLVIELGNCDRDVNWWPRQAVLDYLDMIFLLYNSR